MIVILDGIFNLMRKHRELNLDDAKFIHRFNELIKEVTPCSIPSKSSNVVQLSSVRPSTTS